MKYSVNKEKNQYKITITLDEKEWSEAIENAYQKNKGKYNIQGFRKGKAPRKVIEQTYGKGIFFEDAIDGCFYKYYFEILGKEKQIEPIDAPQVDIKDLSDKGITLIAVVDNKPEVVLGVYKGLTVQKDKVTVKESEIDLELSKMAESRAKFVEVTRPVQNGDYVTIDFAGKVDGVLFEGGTAMDYELEIGSHTFIDNFEEQIIGMNIGEKKDINVKFPDNYHTETLKGKHAVFEVTVKNIKTKELPTIDDKFADDCSEFSTLEELKKDIKNKIKLRKERDAEQKQEEEILKMITDASKVEIPQSLIDRQVEDFLRDFEYRLSYQGLKLEEYVNYMGTTIEDLKKDKRVDAENTVKTRLVIEKILTDENITVSDQDIADKYNIGKEKPLSIAEVKKELNNEQLAYMENGLLLKKFFDFLKANNNM